MSKIYIGIDNGMKGAIALLATGKVIVYPMPILGKEVDCTRFLKLIETLSFDGGNVHSTIEHPTCMPKQSTQSTLTYGVHCGVIRGILEAVGIPYTLVRPRDWQKEMLKGVKGENTKQKSVKAAKRLFPGVSLLPTEKCRKDSDGMSDALLMAEYGRRKNL